jgi:hypothetical protein
LKKPYKKKNYRKWIPAKFLYAPAQITPLLMDLKIAVKPAPFWFLFV